MLARSVGSSAKSSPASSRSSAKSVAAGPASSPKGMLPSWFRKRLAGTQKKSSKSKGEAGKGLLARSISSSSSSSSPKSVAASSRSSAKSVAAAAVKGSKSPKPASPAAASGWSSDDDSPKSKPKFMVKIKPLVPASAAAASGAAAASVKGSKSPKPASPAAAAASGAAAAGPGSSKIKGSVKIVPVIVTPKASAAASGWDAPPPAWMGISSFSSTSPKSSSKLKGAFAAAAASKVKSASVKSSKSPKAAAAAASGWGSVIGPALHDDSYSSAAPVSDVSWATPKAAAAKKSPSPSVGGPLGIKETVMINKYARMIVKYNQTHNPSDSHKATAFFNKNEMNKIPQEKLKYIPNLVQDLQDNPSGSESIMNNEKLLDDLADVIIEQENDNVANSLYMLYQMFEQGDIDEAIEYFLKNGLYNLDMKLIAILEDNPTTRLRLLKLEEKPVEASWSSDDSSKGRKPKIMIKMKSPKSLSGAVAASVAVPKLAPYTGDSKVKIVRRFTPDELAVINEFVRLMVLFKKTDDLRYVDQAVKINDENNMLKIPGLTIDYLQSEIEKLSSVGGPSVSAAAASAAVPPSKKEKALKASAASGASASAASASAAGESFLESILKNAKKHDKNEKKLKKYHRLVRERKIKEANAYSIKHKIAKIPGAFDKFESVVFPVDDGDDYVSVTPPIESPVPLSPEVLKKAPLSFGQAAAMAAASGTPKAKSKGKGKGAISVESPLSKLHKEIVHRAVSPTFAKHDPKHGAWAG